MADDYAANTQTTGTVPVGGSATGEIESGGDRDWFAVTLTAGKTYRFDLEGSQTGAGSLSDPYLRGIYDSNGDPIKATTNDDGGTGYNSRVTFTPDAAGVYYVSAGAYGSGTGTYKLSVTAESVSEPAGGDLPADTSTTGRVEVGGSVTGEIETGSDHDWFAVTLEAGRIYWFDLEGVDTGAGTLKDPLVKGIYEANGNLIDDTDILPHMVSYQTGDSDSGVGFNAQVRFVPDADGIHYVSATGSLISPDSPRS